MTDDNPADPTYFHCKNFANCGNNFFGDDLLSVTDGVESGKKVLEPGDDGNYKSSTSLTDIVRWLTCLWLHSNLSRIYPRNDTQI